MLSVPEVLRNGAATLISILVMEFYNGCDGLVCSTLSLLGLLVFFASLSGLVVSLLRKLRIVAPNYFELARPSVLERVDDLTPRWLGKSDERFIAGLFAVMFGVVMFGVVTLVSFCNHYCHWFSLTLVPSCLPVSASTNPQADVRGEHP